jgi:hypothetical protein
MKIKEQIKQRPPCACYYCQEWIEETDFYRIDFLDKPMCLECYEWIQEDLFDKPDNQPT